MAEYRPSVVVNFKLRFDDRLTLSPSPTPETLDERLRAPANQAALAKPEPLISTPVGIPPGADTRFSWVMARVPESCSVEKPGYRQAGKFSIELDFRDLPIDPRTVRAAAVEIHIGSVSADNFAKGIRGRDPQGRLLSVLQTRDESGQPNEHTLRMVGTVDQWEVTHGEKGSKVKLEGRDLRGILLDTPIAPNGVSPEQFFDQLDTSQDIVALVAAILSYNPLFSDILVVGNPDDWPGSVFPSPGAKDLVPRHRKGAKGTRAGSPSTPPAESSGSNLSFWDVITQFCYLVGAIPFFENTRLTIRPSQTVFDKLRGPVDPVRNPTPFRDGRPRSRDAESGAALTPPLRARRIVYGRDILTLSLTRKYGGWKKPKCVRCVSVDQGNAARGIGKVVEGLWPPQSAPQATRSTSESSGKPKAITDFINIPVPGISSKERLTEIARGIYNEVGRSEIGGEVDTVTLASFGGDNSDPDLLRLEPGDGVELLVNTVGSSAVNPVVSSFIDSQRSSFEAAVSEITRRIGDENLARVIVATARGQVNELQRFFRVECVKYSWGLSGLKVAFSFQNYVEARAGLAETANAFPGAAISVTPNTPKVAAVGRSLTSL